jgi:uncharacterized protein (TIGR02145 family)
MKTTNLSNQKAGSEEFSLRFVCNDRVFCRAACVLTYLFVNSLTCLLFAQISIGDLSEPANGALLDLNKTVKGGVLLSNVEISNLRKIPTGINLFPGITKDTDDDVNGDFTGALVYHTGENDIPAGVYLWNGTNWTPIGEDCHELDSVTIEAAGGDRVVLGGKGITLAVKDENTNCSFCSSQYEWSIAKYDSLNYTPLPSTANSLQLSIDDFSDTLAVYNVKVKIANPYLPAGVGEGALEIAVGGCPVKKSSGEWLFFMCNNLGGEPVTSVLQATTGITQAHHGDWYKFGESNPALTNGEYESGPVPEWDFNDDPDKNNATTYPYYAGAEHAWSWPGTKNPCPSGWHVPRDDQWKVVTDYTTSGNKNTVYYAPFNGEFTGVSQIGDYLFLPIAGRRYYTDGSLRDRGRIGYYWENSYYMPDRNLQFRIGTVAGVLSHSYRNKGDVQSGLTIRCVKQ